MKRFIHFLTLLSMFAMFSVATPSQATACLPNTTVNECCTVGDCGADQLCICCRNESGNPQSLAGAASSYEPGKLLQLAPLQRLTLICLGDASWLQAHPVQLPVVAAAGLNQPVKLYLLHRALLI